MEVRLVKVDELILEMELAFHFPDLNGFSCDYVFE